MDSHSQQPPAAIPPEYISFYKAYLDGSLNSEFVPPSEDPINGVRSKDVVISPQVSARIFLPKITTNHQIQKIPLIIYIHGGAFLTGSAFDPIYNSYVSSLAGEANAVAISVNYRLAPKHRIPDCYDDCWAAFKWVISHSNGSIQGPPESWINDHVDFSRIYFAGDSAGANISHNLAIRASEEDVGALGDGVKIQGVALICPFFGDGSPELVWTYFGPENIGSDDPRLCPMADLNLLSKIVCNKGLVCTAEKDKLRKRGLLYYEALKNCGWDGESEYMEIEAEGHCFHLKNPTSEKAKVLMQILASFIN